MSKTLSLRLDDERAAALEMVARAEDKPFTETIRDAIDAHIEERRNDAEFAARLKARHDRDREVFERLAK